MSTKNLSRLLDSNPKSKQNSKKVNLESNVISSDPLKSTKTRDFELYSEEVLNSKHSQFKKYPEDEFTNFLNSQNEDKFKHIASYFWPEVQNLNYFELDESNYLELPPLKQERLERIFSLYLKDVFSLQNINKIKIRDRLNQSTPFRVFVLIEDLKYKVFLFDPLHLVITDKRTREDEVFLKNKGNGTCMSKLI